jgi:small-conductance mechanosensitive channel
MHLESFSFSESIIAIMTAYVYGLYNYYFKKDSGETRTENQELQQKRQQLVDLDNQITKLQRQRDEIAKELATLIKDTNLG